MSIGIAILGAGDFARDEHLPAIQACPLLTLKAVYSRVKSAAQKISQEDHIDWYYEYPTTPSTSLEDLLARADIHAVVIAVPLFVQSELIRKALAAGKHVLSEKPIAEDVKTAEALIEWYRCAQRKEIWSVAENFRYLPGIILASDQLRSIGGTVTSFCLELYGFVNEQEQAHVQEISSLTAFTSVSSSCPPMTTTLYSAIQLRSGSSGTFNISFGSDYETTFAIEIITDRGSVTVEADRVARLKTDKSGNTVEDTTALRLDNGVKAEVQAFAESIQNGVADERGVPEQALADLRLIQRMLESDEEGGTVKVML
ncbi:MAG: hypothetical protein Q9195_007157 [Heterodermia aff. obscurata]